MTKAGLFSQYAHFLDHHCDHLHRGLNAGTIFSINRDLRLRFLGKGDGYDAILLQLLKFVIPTSETGRLRGFEIPWLFKKRKDLALLDRLFVPLAETQFFKLCQKSEAKALERFQASAAKPKKAAKRAKQQAKPPATDRSLVPTVTDKSGKRAALLIDDVVNSICYPLEGVDDVNTDFLTNMMLLALTFILTGKAIVPADTALVVEGRATLDPADVADQDPMRPMGQGSTCGAVVVDSMGVLSNAPEYYFSRSRRDLL
jgi:hypothetical protein